MGWPTQAASSLYPFWRAVDFYFKSALKYKYEPFTADSSLQDSLAKLPGLTEVRDSGGKILGYFSPASHSSPEAYAQAAAHFDSDEMKQRKASNDKGRTTDEVLKRIASQS